MTQFKEGSFDDLVSEGIVLVDFYSTTCAPCQRYFIVLERRVEPHFKGAVRFVKIDTAERPDLVDRFGIRSIPHLSIFKDGTLVRTLIGVKLASVLKETLSDIVNETSN